MYVCGNLTNLKFFHEVKERINCTSIGLFPFSLKIFVRYPVVLYFKKKLIYYLIKSSLIYVHSYINVSIIIST